MVGLTSRGNVSQFHESLVTYTDFGQGDSAIPIWRSTFSPLRRKLTHHPQQRSPKMQEVPGVHLLGLGGGGGLQGKFGGPPFRLRFLMVTEMQDAVISFQATF